MRTGELQSGLQVLDCNRTLAEVNILYGETQDLRYTSAQVEKHPDQQPIPKIGSRLLHPNCVIRFNVYFHCFLLLPLWLTGTLIKLPILPAAGRYLDDDALFSKSHVLKPFPINSETRIPVLEGMWTSKASLGLVAAAISLSTCSGSRYPFKSRIGVICTIA